MPIKILHYRLWPILFAGALVGCARPNLATAPRGNPFPNIEVAPVSMPISSYGCKYIVQETDTLEVDRILCADSVKFGQLFSGIVVDQTCIDIYSQGTTWYSVAVGERGEFTDLKVVREVDGCFQSTTAQIAAVLAKNHILEKAYYNTELMFYHQFRIKKGEN